MKKYLFLAFLLFLIATPSFAINFGMYKTETEYGLIDGFKWNILNHKEGEPLVQLKSETKEEQERLEKEKNKPKEEQDEIQMYKFMIDNVNAF